MSDSHKLKLDQMTASELVSRVLSPVLSRIPTVAAIEAPTEESPWSLTFDIEGPIRSTRYAVLVRAGDIAVAGQSGQTVEQIVDRSEVTRAIAEAKGKSIDIVLVVAGGRISRAAKAELTTRFAPVPVEVWDGNDIERRVAESYPELLLPAQQGRIEYMASLRNQFDRLDVLDQLPGVSAKNLSDVFVEPMLKRKIDPSIAESEDRARGLQPVPGLKLPDTHPHVVIVGDQNDGKTTLFHMIAITAAQEFLGGRAGESDPIPVVLRANQLLKAGTVEAAVEEAIRRFTNDLNWLSSITPEELLLLVDGFSELHDNKDKREVEVLVEEWGGSQDERRWVIAARPEDFLTPDYFNRAAVYHFAEFSDKQVKDLVQRWTRGAVGMPDVAQKLVGRVRDALQLPGSPIPAIIGVLMYEEEKRYITNTAEAVDRYMVIRLGRYAREMGLAQEVDWTRKQDLLADLAFDMVKNDIDEVGYETAQEYFDSVFDELGEEPKSDTALTELIEGGVLDLHDGKVGFHRTAFRDFFAAHYVNSRGRIFDDFFKANLFDRRWGSVLTFAAGLRRHNTELLTELNATVRKEKGHALIDVSSDYIYASYLLGRILSNSEAAHEGARLEVLRTCLDACKDSLPRFEVEAVDQFGPIGRLAALVGIEQTFFVTVGVPWLQKQFRDLAQDPEVTEEERYLLLSAHAQLGGEGWIGGLREGLKEIRSPRGLIAMSVLLQTVRSDRDLEEAEDRDLKQVEKSLERKIGKNRDAVKGLLKIRSKLLQLEVDRVRRLENRN